ncbi:MAG: hypothetical protein H0T76_06115 [Nannocystis sp.]|nr:PCI domain-containing protein [Nannocystis sp.]MBA3546036.1 hypothetical protein [Nannocystis sp.]
MTITSKLILGGVLAFVGVSCSAVAVGMIVAPSRPEQPSAGVAVLIMTFGAFVVPGTVLLWVGLLRRRHARHLDQVVAMGQASARLPLAQLGEQLGIPVPRARELVLEAIAAGKLVGRLDHEHGVFLSGSAHTGVQKIGVQCPSCSGISQVILAPGVAAHCSFCGLRVA